MQAERASVHDCEMRSHKKEKEILMLCGWGVVIPRCDWWCCRKVGMRLVVVALCRCLRPCVLEDDRAGVAGVALVSTIRTIKHQYLAIRVAGNMQSDVSGRFVVEVVPFGVW